MGLAIWIGLLIAVAGFIALAGVLAIVPLYGGFTMLWYWATVDKLDFRMAPASIIGAIAGTGSAWALQQAGALHSDLGTGVLVAGILLAVLLQILQRATLVINSSFMLFLTICGAPALQLGEDFRQVIASILLGAVYFGVIVWLLNTVLRRRRIEVPAPA